MPIRIVSKFLEQIKIHLHYMIMSEIKNCKIVQYLLDKVFRWQDHLHALTMDLNHNPALVVPNYQKMHQMYLSVTWWS